MAATKTKKAVKGKSSRRLDKEWIVLRKGEQQRADDVYEYRWTTPDGKRHSVYAGTLELLREKEEQAAAAIRDGIKTETKLITVNEAFDMCCDLKRGIKDNTFQNYWYPIFAAMLGTGLRVGETVGLRWCDIDLEEGMISINHALTYYDKGGIERCSFSERLC